MTRRRDPMTALRRAAIVPLMWGCWLGCLNAVQFAFHPQPFVFWFLHGLLGGAAVCCFATGLANFVVDLRRRRVPAFRAFVEASATTAVTVVGLALAMLGAEFGLWAAYIGGGILLAGLGGLAREARAQRRALAQARYHRAAPGAPGSPPASAEGLP